MSMLWHYASFDDDGVVIVWSILSVVIGLALVIFFLLMFLPWDKIQGKHEEKVLRRRQIEQQEREAELKRQQEAKAKRLAEEEKRKRRLAYFQSNIVGVDLHRKKKHVNYRETDSYSCSGFGVMNGGLGFSNSTIIPNYRKEVIYEDEFKPIILYDAYKEKIPGKFDAYNNQAYRTLWVIGFELSCFVEHNQNFLHSIKIRYNHLTDDRPIIASEWDDIVLIMKDGNRKVAKGTEFREIKYE